MGGRYSDRLPTLRAARVGYYPGSGLAVAMYGPRGLRPLGYRRSGPAAPGLRYPRAPRLAHARATVVHNADVPSPLPKAMNRATKGVTVHAHTLRPCHALCERHR
jgi:hypothetical protein